MLWKKIMQGLSAGRVQSVATRIVVERERDRMRFRPGTWWSLAGSFTTEEGEGVEAALVSLGGRPIADGSDFTSAGELARADGPILLDATSAAALAAALEAASFAVAAVETKPYRRSPSAPFITSTLQQEAARKLGFTAQRTMQVAQRLYEQGHITYMRTDSTTLSATAIAAARQQARQIYGAALVPERAAHLRATGEERPGSARGDPAGRRQLPAPRRDRRGGRCRRAPALRAHLAKDDRLADDRRDRGHGPPPHRRCHDGADDRRGQGAPRPSSPPRGR